MRTQGCALVAITIQVIFQLRILEEVYYRLRFIATDSYLKDKGSSLSSFWDPNRRSKSVLRELRTSGEHVDTLGNTLLRVQDIGKITSFHVDVEKQGLGGSNLLLGLHPYHQLKTTLPLWTARTLLLFGLGLSVVGYIG